MNTRTASKEALWAEAQRQGLNSAIRGRFDDKHPTIEEKRNFLASQFSLAAIDAPTMSEDEVLVEYRLHMAGDEAEYMFKNWMTEAGREEEL